MPIANIIYKPSLILKIHDPHVDNRRFTSFDFGVHEDNANLSEDNIALN